MDYHGTNGDDILDQTNLGLPDWSNIYGGIGNDTITIGVGNANGEAGNDTIIGTSSASTVFFWSPQGVVVNFATGFAQDGYGTIDKLINIRVVQGTGYDDEFIGSSANEEFWGLGGNDTFIGGGGDDAVVFWDTKYSDSIVTYDVLTDTFTVKKNTSWGDHGTAILSGIHTLFFRTPTEEYSITKFDIGSFPKIYANTVSRTPGTFAGFVKGGDFNGDGVSDLLVVQQMGSGTAVVPNMIFTGDGTGKFTDASELVFSKGVGISVGGRAIVADFNNDGISDIFQLGFGDDAPPFPGGLNQLFLSSSITGRIEDESSSIHQSVQLNHGGSAGDINGDGYFDILINSLKDGNFLQLNDGTGHFIDRSDLIPHPVGTWNQALTNTFSGIIDLNGDGKDDIILGKWDAEGSAPTSQVLLNDGTGNFTKHSPINLPFSGVTKEIVLDVKPIDLNGDTLPDLMLDVTNGSTPDSTFYRTPYIQLLVNDGNGQFHDETSTRLPQELVGNSDWYMELKSIDFNRDGYPDILATVAGSIPSAVYLNQKNGTFTKAWQSVAGAKTIGEDVDNDGLVDLVTYVDSNNPTINVNKNILTNGHIYKANWGGEKIIGSNLSDNFFSRNGNSIFDGNSGIDTLIYSGNRSSYTITPIAGGFTIIDKDLTDGDEGKVTIYNIERLKFADSRQSLIPNIPPTGTVTITGAAFVGQVLTAFNTLDDQDGLGSISYQWEADGVAISGATMNTFTIAAAQVGKIITVVATYTDGFGTEESQSSKPTASVSILDVIPPTANSFSPIDEATDVAIGSNIVVTFSEPIARGTGNIVLKAAGVTVASYDTANSSNISISGVTLTIVPTTDLSNNTAYTVEFSVGSIKDLAGNSYEGTTSYNFTTVATTPPVASYSVPGTLGNDFFIPSGGNSYFGGGGNDTYIISSYTLNGAVTAKIIDTEGSNVIQLVDGLTIASSSFYSNAVQLKLSNGASVQILGAAAFSYQVGANAPAGDTASSQTYSQFASTLGASVPTGSTMVSGIANYQVPTGASAAIQMVDANSTEVSITLVGLNDLDGALL